MSEAKTDDELVIALRESIESAIPDSRAEVTANGGRHFSIVVRSADFEGKKTLDKQRIVYAAIAHLMGDDTAPVHAIDEMKTLTE